MSKTDPIPPRPVAPGRLAVRQDRRSVRVARWVLVSPQPIAVFAGSLQEPGQPYAGYYTYGFLTWDGAVRAAHTALLRGWVTA